MADEFNPINTQEDFDARVAELYGDVKGLQGQIETLTGQRNTDAQTITNLQNQVKGYEARDLRQRIAREKNIPYELADRLAGESEEDIRKDADNLAQLIRSVRGTDPLFNPDPVVKDPGKAALARMVQEMEGE